VTEQTLHTKTAPKLKRKRLALKRASLLVSAIAIFLLGLNIGNGRITIMSQTGVQKDLPNRLDYSSVDEVYKALKANFDGKLDTNALNDGMKKGLVNAAGDPHTEYFNASDYKDFNNQLTGTFTGIGAELNLDSNNNVVVIAPIAGAPADKAGLKAKDIIAEIDGKSTVGMSVSQAVDLIHGQSGTTVKLKIIRDGTPQDISIVRAQISVPSVTTKVENGIGYLTISRFGDDTADLAQKAAQTFKDQHVTGIVLDMRGNPGGLLDAAVSVSSLWLPDGTTVLTERRDGIITNTYKAQGSSPLHGIPTVALIDGGSASASEITAGALKDNGAAVLIGEKSYGKGSVQQLVKLSGGAFLKVTVARWYTPNGKNIDKAGITPDQTVQLTATDSKNGQDPQMAAALKQLGK